jgi:hypothetical protein
MSGDKLPIVDYRSPSPEVVRPTTWLGVAIMGVLLLVAVTGISVVAYAALMWVAHS